MLKCRQALDFHPNTLNFEVRLTIKLKNSCKK